MFDIRLSAGVHLEKTGRGGSDRVGFILDIHLLLSNGIIIVLCFALLFPYDKE